MALLPRGAVPIWCCFHVTLLPRDDVAKWRCCHVTFLPHEIVSMWRCCHVVLYHVVLLLFDAVVTRHCCHDALLQYDRNASKSIVYMITNNFAMVTHVMCHQFSIPIFHTRQFRG